MKAVALSLVAFLTLGCASTIAPTIAVEIVVWMDTEDFDACGIEKVEVSIDGQFAAILTNPGGFAIMVEHRQFLTVGVHQYAARSLDNTRAWNGPLVAVPDPIAEVHICCGDSCLETD